MKIKNIEKIFAIEKGDVISIVGSGGKTTLMFQLANSLKNKYRVLITTSTKIFRPSVDKYDYIYTSFDDYKNNKVEYKSGITVVSKDYNYENNKLLGIDDNILKSIINDFDVTVIEADGSRNLPLKGWKNHEPPILSKTNKTIGIIPIDVLGKKISKENIYGYEEFQNFVNNEDIVNKEIIGRICSSKVGIFKNSMGKRYLLINKADSDEDLKNAHYLANYLNDYIKGNPFDFKICISSLKNAIFYEL
ncbi:selenium cofactor biosynthesis protein YqeC [Sedimentibacter sp. MB31-C6]|uniref:selenium cofactor biosynthesis protein YqeC n=1 Tax=Sedimentibacter sp. MB31-C6 TaxID=3109366 RepID=UPI002DDC9E93|nr:selenium cofactor biosynthesis protein YqeC [Sedimentibacter sp. MB36-C1]WSI04767.1 selenium cofactor biosynthesis protein YqeC [Sedimentibacter sp. MB36-C1]